MSGSNSNQLSLLDMLPAINEILPCGATLIARNPKTSRYTVACAKGHEKRDVRAGVVNSTAPYECSQCQRDALSSNCEQCHAPFVRKTLDQRFCSRNCYGRAHYAVHGKPVRKGNYKKANPVAALLALDELSKQWVVWRHKQHVATCKSNGAEPDPMDRFLEEAIACVKPMNADEIREDMRPQHCGLHDPHVSYADHYFNPDKSL